MNSQQNTERDIGVAVAKDKSTANLYVLQSNLNMKEKLFEHILAKDMSADEFKKQLIQLGLEQEQADQQSQENNQTQPIQ